MINTTVHTASFLMSQTSLFAKSIIITITSVYAAQNANMGKYQLKPSVKNLAEVPFWKLLSNTFSKIFGWALQETDCRSFMRIPYLTATKTYF